MLKWPAAYLKSPSGVTASCLTRRTAAILLLVWQACFLPADPIHFGVIFRDTNSMVLAVTNNYEADVEVYRLQPTEAKIGELSGSGPKFLLLVEKDLTIGTPYRYEARWRNGATMAEGVVFDGLTSGRLVKSDAFAGTTLLGADLYTGPFTLEFAPGSVCSSLGDATIYVEEGGQLIAEEAQFRGVTIISRAKSKVVLRSNRIEGQGLELTGVPVFQHNVVLTSYSRFRTAGSVILFENTFSNQCAFEHAEGRLELLDNRFSQLSIQPAPELPTNTLITSEVILRSNSCNWLTVDLGNQSAVEVESNHLSGLAMQTPSPVKFPAMARTLSITNNIFSTPPWAVLSLRDSALSGIRFEGNYGQTGRLYRLAIEASHPETKALTRPARQIALNAQIGSLEVALDGFQILSNLFQNHWNSEFDVGAIWLKSSGNEVRGNSIRGELAAKGVGIQIGYPPPNLDVAHPVSQGNHIESNEVYQCSYGLVIFQAESNLITANLFESNRVNLAFQDATLHFASVTPVITNNEIYNNIFRQPVEHNFEAYGGANSAACASNRFSVPKIPGVNIVGGPFMGGNYWSHYRGTLGPRKPDVNQDGLGDYPLTLFTGLEDPLPLLANDTLIVNLASDEPDAAANDEVADVDTSQTGLQTTLRAAIQEANRRPGRDTIHFAIPGGRVPRISPLTALPEITDPVELVGYSQPEGTVLLDGQNRSFPGLKLTAGASVVSGLTVSGFGGHGLHLIGKGGNTLSANVLGVPANDKLGAQGNLGHGLFIDDSWENLVEYNQFNGNGGHGLLLQGVYADHNQILENRITGNAGDGIVVSNQAWNNRFEANVIGPDPAAPQLGSNQGNGISLRDAPDNTIGSGGHPADEPERGNTIWANRGHGILVQGSLSTNNVIDDNVIGYHREAGFDYGNGLDGIRIENAPQNLIGGEYGNSIVGHSNAAIRVIQPGARANTISLNNIGCVAEPSGILSPHPNGLGIVIEGGISNNISENLVSACLSDAITLKSHSVFNQVYGNVIGAYLRGFAGTNGGHGIAIYNSADNQVGPLELGQLDGAYTNANYIGGNRGHGILVQGYDARRNTVINNFIGLDASLTNAVGNDGDGVRLEEASESVVYKNSIAGNGGSGIALIGNRSVMLNDIFENEIGVGMANDVEAPLVVLPNAAGILLSGAMSNAICYNVVAGNKGHGLTLMDDSDGNEILGNHFGATDGPSVVIGNGGHGIWVTNSSENHIGGPVPPDLEDVVEDPTNYIVGNQGCGIYIQGTEAFENRIQGNFVGLSDEPRTEAGNQEQGVRIDEAQGTIIGISPDDVLIAGLSNIISGNLADGIQLKSGAAFTVIQGNAIGTDASGTRAVPNHGCGIQLVDALTNSVGLDFGNLIAGNQKDAVLILGSDSRENWIVANTIGYNKVSKTAIPGHRNGIRFGVDTSRNVISNNLITACEYDGILIRSEESLLGNVIRDNRIYANGELGIDIGGDGPTVNDASLPQPPLLHAAEKTATGDLLVSVSLRGTPSRSYGVQLFSSGVKDESGYGEGEHWFEVTNLTASVSGTNRFLLVVPLASADPSAFVSATLIDYGVGTSEFGLSHPVTPAKDSDDDGVPDLVEQNGRNQGDANGDHLPDYLQKNVASIPCLAGQYATLLTSNTLLQVRAYESPAPANFPPGFVFKYGLFAFTVGEPDPENPAQVELILPEGAAANSYYKYGPTPDQSEPHWYEFKYDGSSGAKIEEGKIVLYLRDGQKGDDDLQRNGLIVDLGGPVWIVGPVLKEPKFTAPGQFQFQVEVPSPGSYQVQHAQQTLAWQPLQTTNVTGTAFEVLADVQTSQGARYYRVLKLP